MVSRPTAHKACAQPSCPCIRLPLTESQAAKIGLLERWQAAWDRKSSRASRKAGISNQLQSALNQLVSIAQSEHWSQRKLAAKVGLPESTLRKIKRGQVRPDIWLPRLQAALNRITPDPRHQNPTDFGFRFSDF